MESKTIEKTMDMASSAMKLAANLSEKKPAPEPPRHIRPDDNSNNATTGSQSVNVVLDTGKKKEPKPVEKHIHTFPENRPLTTEECELALKREQMAYELEKAKQEHLIRMDNLEWQHRLEVERKNERKNKIRRAIGGILVALGVGGTCWCAYTDYKHNKAAAVPAKHIPETTVKAEGEVK